MLQKVKAVEHFLTYVLVICIYSVENCSFRSLAPWLIDWLICSLRCLIFQFFIYFFDINPVPDGWVTKVSFHSVGCLFIWFMLSFALQKLWKFMESHLSLLGYFLGCWSSFKKLSSMPIPGNFLLCFSYSMFKDSELILRSLVHFDFILHEGEKYGSNIILLHMDIQYS